MKTATLSSGQIVKVGDIVSFVNSDDELCIAPIFWHNGEFRFWNSNAEITDYVTAKRLTKRELNSAIRNARLIRLGGGLRFNSIDFRLLKQH